MSISILSSAFKIFLATMRDYTAEVFACLMLDSRHRVLGYYELFHGSIGSDSVHPREVVRLALKENAAAVIFAHNHPAGDATPSAADREITLRLSEAPRLVEARVLDHLVIGEEVLSMAAQGLLPQ